MQEKLVSRAKELLSDGTVVRVLGWRKGDTDFSAEPASAAMENSISKRSVKQDARVLPL